MKFLDNMKFDQINPNDLAAKILNVRAYIFTKNKISVFANKLFTYRWREFLANVLDVFVTLLQLEVATLGEPARMLQPRIVIPLPVAKASVAEEALHVVTLP